MNKFFLFLLWFFLLKPEAVKAQDDGLFDSLSAPGETNTEKRGVFSVPAQASPANVRRLPKDKVEGLKKSEDYWYANLEPQKEEVPKEQLPKSGKSLFEQSWFQNLLWIIILCSFIGVVVWYLAMSNVSLFRRQAKKLPTEAQTPETSDDIFSIAYEEEIAAAEAAENFRLAVRLRYLQTLKILSAKNLVAYRPERPNGDYVLALFGTGHYNAFFRLTRNFDYTWYGQFPLSAKAYQAVKADFQTFQKSLPA